MLEDHLGVYLKTVRTAEALTKVMSENAEPLEALANPLAFWQESVLGCGQCVLSLAATDNYFLHPLFNSV